MKTAIISGTGLYTPKESISNDELVAAFNTYVANFNKQNAQTIEAGEIEALAESSSEFILKASGIESRYVMNKSGILDPERMCPYLPERSNDEPSLQCEMSLVAAKEALAQAGKTVDDVDAVIVACSNHQRPYPAISVEVQTALGIDGYAYDMNVACSSATFGLQAAINSIQNGQAKGVLVICPEICSGHLNFRDRDSHFIFGDACSALFIEAKDTCTSNDAYEVLDTNLITKFSNNIRNNAGFLNRCDEAGIGQIDKLFIQNGRKVFKDVVPWVAGHISDALSKLSMQPSDLKRMWLHQANLNMNLLIAKKVLGPDASAKTSPTILNEYANTSSAGSIIAFHKCRDDMQAGDTGVICSYGAGYSLGSVIVKKC